VPGEGAGRLPEDGDEQATDVGLEVLPLAGHDPLLVGQPGGGADEVPLSQRGLLHDEAVGGLRLDVGGEGGAGGVQAQPEGFLLEGGVVEVDPVPLQRLGLPGEPGAERLQGLRRVGVVERGEVGRQPDHLGGHVRGLVGGQPDGAQEVPERPGRLQGLAAGLPERRGGVGCEVEDLLRGVPEDDAHLGGGLGQVRRLGDGLLEELPDLLRGEGGGEQPGGLLGDAPQRADDPRRGRGVEPARVGAEPDGGFTQDRDSHPALLPSPGRGLRGLHGCLLVR
jgi:hypothetical protein